MCKFIPIFKPSHFYVYFILKHLKSTSGCAHLKKKITFVSEYQYKRPANKMLLNNKRFELFFNTYYEPVYLFSLKYVREEPVAQDIAQNVFVRLYEREKIFTPSKKPNLSLIRLHTTFVLIICDIPRSHKNIFHNGKRKKSKIVFTKLLIRKHSVYSVSPSANCPRKPGKLSSSVWRATIILKSQIFCISLSTPSNQ